MGPKGRGCAEAGKGARQPCLVLFWGRGGVVFWKRDLRRKLGVRMGG